jgi:hypothetical protein
MLAEWLQGKSVEGYCMKRRAFMAGLGGMVAWPPVARAQAAGKQFRVGFVLARFPQAQMAGPEPVSLVTRLFARGRLQ